jgi:hypothetical protein
VAGYLEDFGIKQDISLQGMFSLESVVAVMFGEEIARAIAHQLNPIWGSTDFRDLPLEKDNDAKQINILARMVDLTEVFQQEDEILMPREINEAPKGAMRPPDLKEFESKFNQAISKMARVHYQDGHPYHIMSITDKTYEMMIQKEKLRVHENIKKAMSITELFDRVEKPYDGEESVARQIQAIKRENQHLERAKTEALVTGIEKKDPVKMVEAFKVLVRF